MILAGRTKLSARGQIVIPKSIRDSWGIADGCELEVMFDGFTLRIRAAGSDIPVTTESVVNETPGSYGTNLATASGGSVATGRLASQIWLERAMAIEGIKRLRKEFTGLDADELVTSSRQELMRRSETCK